MLAIYLLLVIVGYAVGRMHADALYWARSREPRPLPAATPRAIARQARRNRADLRHVRPAREAGARLLDARIDPRGDLQRLSVDQREVANG